MHMMVTCDYRRLKEALNAAIAVSGSDPFDMIRLYPQLELSRLGVAAASPQSVFVAFVDLDFMKETSHEVDVAEISVQDAKALKALPIRAQDDEVPMAGLAFYEDRVELTDETGLGLGIRKISVRRQTANESVANLLNSVDRALAMEFSDSLPLHKDQAVLLSKVLSSLKAPAKLSYRKFGPGVSKVRAIGTNFLLTIQAGKVKQNAEQPATPEHQTASQKPILEVARPAGGIA